MTGSPATQLTEGARPATTYGSYSEQSQPTFDPNRGDPYYYSQSAGTPAPTLLTEGSYGHQYVPFRQTHLTLQYPETSQPSPSQPSPVSQSPQRLTSEGLVGEQHVWSTDEARYGSVRNR